MQIRKIDSRLLRVDANGVLKFANTVAYVKSMYGYDIDDSSDKLIVDVKPRDIRNGVPRDAFQCAFAQAIMRQEHGNVEAIVCQRIMMLINHDTKKAMRYRTDPKITAMVRKFDGVFKMSAGTYRFLPIEHTAKLGTQRERKTGPHTAPKKRNVSVITPNFRHWIVASPEITEEIRESAMPAETGA